MHLESCSTKDMSSTGDGTLCPYPRGNHMTSMTEVINWHQTFFIPLVVRTIAGKLPLAKDCLSQSFLHLAVTVWLSDPCHSRPKQGCDFLPLFLLLWQPGPHVDDSRRAMEGTCVIRNLVGFCSWFLGGRLWTFGISRVIGAPLLFGVGP